MSEPVNTVSCWAISAIAARATANRFNFLLTLQETDALGLAMDIAFFILPAFLKPITAIDLLREWWCGSAAPPFTSLKNDLRKRFNLR